MMTTTGLIYTPYKFSLKQVFRIAILIFLAEIIILSPWLFRNYIIHNEIVLSTYGGWNFLLGNNELTLQEIQNRKEVDKALSNHMSNSLINLEKLTEPEMDKWFYQKGFEFIENNPITFLKLLWLKTINLWSVRLNPPSKSFWKELIYSLSYGAILFFSIPGIWLSFKNWRNFFLVYLLFIYFTISYIPFITLSRYRKPLDPYLAMFAILFYNLFY